MDCQWEDVHSNHDRFLSFLSAGSLGSLSYANSVLMRYPDSNILNGLFFSLG